MSEQIDILKANLTNTVIVVDTDILSGIYVVIKEYITCSSADNYIYLSTDGNITLANVNPKEQTAEIVCGPPGAFAPVMIPSSYKF